MMMVILTHVTIMIKKPLLISLIIYAGSLARYFYVSHREKIHFFENDIITYQLFEHYLYLFLFSVLVLIVLPSMGLYHIYCYSYSKEMHVSGFTLMEKHKVVRAVVAATSILLLCMPLFYG